MISIQRLLGRPRLFFGQLESSVDLGVEAAGILCEIVMQPERMPTLDAIAACRRREKVVTSTIEETLTRVGVPPIERQDLELIAQSLYKLPKGAEKFIERYIIGWDKVSDLDFTPPAVLLQKATRIVQEMVISLGAQGTLSDIKALDARLSQLEANASGAILTGTRRLYSPGCPPLKAIIAKDLYDILSQCVDNCRDIGRTISLVILNNS
jgi:uncharacterized protein